MGDTLVRLGERAPFSVVAGGFQQVERERVAAFVALLETALQTQGSPFRAEHHEVADATLPFLGNAPIDVLLAQALELEPVLLLARRLFGASRSFALPLVATLVELALALDLLATLALAIVLAHGMPLLGSKAHLASRGELDCRPTAAERAGIHAPLRLRFQAQAGLELLAAGTYAP